MTKQQILDEVGRRLGDTSSNFVTTVLSPIFDHMLDEMATNDAIQSLRKTATFAFTAGTTSYSTQTITGLTGQIYPLEVRKLLVPRWGTEGLLERLEEQEFDKWRLHWTKTDGTVQQERPMFWRLYPNYQTLQVLPSPRSADATANAVEITYVAPSSVLLDTDNIAEIQRQHLHVVIAGMIKHGLVFQDETLTDAKTAYREFELGMQRMKNQQAREFPREFRTKYRDF